MKNALLLAAIAALPAFAWEPTACITGGKKMLTPWGEKLTPANALREYPRPQMVRANWTCLNGLWDYAITSITNTPGRPTKWDGQILVPFALEAPLSGVGRLLQPTEYLWYTRKLVCHPRPGERILLHFGAVDFRTIVYIGHQEVTEVPHEGGQLPFALDITKYVKDGENDLTVLVWDPTEDFVQTRGKQSYTTHSCYYTRVSGIWQTVWMETVPEKYIADYAVTPDIDRGVAKFVFTVEGLKYGDGKFGKLEILDGGKTLARVDFAPGRPVEVSLPKGFALWSPESPKLYDFKARYGADEVTGYFAMRKIEKRADSKSVLRFYLNNKPYYILGTLDQGWWPDGLLTPPSEEAMAFDIQTLKDCGFNTMRKHIKVEPLRYYALCDKIGLLLLQDMPCAGTSFPLSPFNPEIVKTYSLFRNELKGMIDLLGKVPSIVMWIPYNEGWGQHDQNLTHTTLDWTKRYDPTRLVNGPSGWQDFEGGELTGPFNGKKWTRVVTRHKPANECEAADCVDYHYYRGPAMPPLNPRRISFLGEFGGLGHPVEEHLWRGELDKTMKGDRKGAWGYGGIDDTRTREGLEKTYLGLMTKLGEFAEQGLCGSIYTQTTDVEIEINGLLTYDRKVLKFDPKVLKAAHEEVVRKHLQGCGD